MPTVERWRTGVTEIAPGRIAPRGRDIAELIASASWTEVIWLVLYGSTPSAEQDNALRRALVAAVDHGVAAPSTASARVVASTRVAPSIALAVGLTAFAGPAHGGAASEAARILQAIVAGETTAEEVVRDLRARGERVPGYGIRTTRSIRAWRRCLRAAPPSAATATPRSRWSRPCRRSSRRACG